MTDGLGSVSYGYDPLAHLKTETRSFTNLGSFTLSYDEELLNRCIVLTVDEDREQTRAIHRLQRERQTLEGMWARDERQALRKLHRDAQRLLRPLEVVNPFARELTFLDDQTRTRRDHMKYLALIQ